MAKLRHGFRNVQLPVAAAAFIAAVCVAILALSGWREWEARQSILQNAEIDMANLARSLIQHADDSFELIDNTLTVLVNQLELEGTPASSIKKIQTFLQRRNPAGRVRGIFVYDEEGRWLATTEKIGDLSALNNSDRDYFQRHRTSLDRATFIGQPVRSRSGGQWIITASRRYNHPDGTFAGVALATIDVSYFSAFYEKFDVGPNGAITLMNRDGTLLARSRDDGTYVGRDMSQAPLFRELRERPSEGVYYFKSPLDDVQRLSFYRLSARNPLMILAMQAQADVLAPWREGARTRLLIVMSLVSLIGLTGFLLVKQLLQRQRLAAALVAKEADFRLLAEQSGDMVMRIGFDEQILYVSPSCARVVGWSANQLTGKPALGGINAEDLPRVREAVESLKNGEIEELKVIYRTRHREKQEIWVETALRVTRNEISGSIDGVVAISRDMTEHKDLEDRLATLATADGLTGIANRRHFDDRLQEEWARARRSGMPLSLLLIDVDHFKKFNDCYGHQAGDDCLRAVAHAIAEQAHRTTDLAARYGGEEFALLLPDTDADGCKRIADQVLAALHTLKIPHANNPPAHRVTASVGVSTRWGIGESSEFVQAADRALYAAKDSGRDRSIMSGQVVAWPGIRSA